MAVGTERDVSSENTVGRRSACFYSSQKKEEEGRSKERRSQPSTRVRMLLLKSCDKTKDSKPFNYKDSKVQKLDVFSVSLNYAIKW
jgi:hypothetical protein